MDARLSACTGKALAILAFVFMGGVTLGVVGMQVLGNPPVVSSAQHGGVFHHQESGMAVEELRLQLDLSDAQVQKIHMILDESIMAETNLLDQLQVVQTDGRARIVELLDQEQRAKFNEWVRELAGR